MGFTAFGLNPLSYISTLSLELSFKSKSNYIIFVYKIYYCISIVLRTEIQIINMAQKTLWDLSSSYISSPFRFYVSPLLRILTILAFLQAFKQYIFPSILWSSQVSFPSIWHSNSLLITPTTNSYTHTHTHSLKQIRAHQCTPKSEHFNVFISQLNHQFVRATHSNHLGLTSSQILTTFTPKHNMGCCWTYSAVT